MNTSATQSPRVQADRYAATVLGRITDEKEVKHIRKLHEMNDNTVTATGTDTVTLADQSGVHD